MGIRVRFLAFACCLVAAGASSGDRAPVQARVSASSSLVVGFVPPDSDSFWSSRGAAEHEFHLANALSLAASCLQAKGVEFRTVRADWLEVETAGVINSVDLNISGRIGAYLVRSDRPPKVLSCASGTSPLQVVVPVSAAIYFDHPECIPDEWRESGVSEKC